LNRLQLHLLICCTYVVHQLCVKLTAVFLSRHQGEAVTVETIAANSLTQSEKALDLIRGVINRENKVKDQVKDLKRL